MDHIIPINLLNQEMYVFSSAKELRVPMVTYNVTHQTKQGLEFLFFLFKKKGPEDSELYKTNTSSGDAVSSIDSFESFLLMTLADKVPTESIQ